MRQSVVLHYSLMKEEIYFETSVFRKIREYNYLKINYHSEKKTIPFNKMTHV